MSEINVTAVMTPKPEKFEEVSPIAHNLYMLYTMASMDHVSNLPYTGGHSRI